MSSTADASSTSDVSTSGGPVVVKANPDRKKVVVRSNRIPDKILNDPGYYGGLQPAVLRLQWGSEYRPFKYWEHLNTELFEVRISNGCNRPTIQIPDLYIRK